MAFTTTTIAVVTDPRLNGAIKSIQDSIVMGFNTTKDSDETPMFPVMEKPYRKWDCAQLLQLGPGEEIPEGVDPPMRQIDPGDQISRALSKYGNSTEATVESLKDSKAGAQLDLADIISEGLSHSRTLTVHDIQQLWYIESLEGVTASTNGGKRFVDTRALDGLSYFNSAHTFKGRPGIANSNLSPAIRPLTVTNIRSAMRQAMGWKDDTGKPLQFGCKGLLVGDAGVGPAQVFLNSEKDPDNANNAQNVLKYQNYGKAVTGIEHWNRMGDDDWALEFDVAQGTRYRGPTHYFMSGERNMVPAPYPKTNSRKAMVFEYTMWMGVFGDNPYQWLTSRAAIT